MISCKQSTEWVIQKEQGQLSVKDNLQLLSHLAICSLCRLFEKQSLLINEALLLKKEIEHSGLSAAEKDHLLRSIQSKLQG